MQSHFLYLAIISLVTRKSLAGALVCKSALYDDLVCIPYQDSYESLSRECCNSLSLITSSFPNCSNFFTQLNLSSPHDFISYKCQSGTQVQLYSSNLTQNRSRRLYYACNSSAVSISINIYTATQYTHPILLTTLQSSVNSFSTFSQGTYSSLYKYTSMVSVTMLKPVDHRVLHLEPGSIKRNCYPNTSFTGLPSSSYDTGAGSAHIPEASQIGCTITAYILPTHNSSITITLNTDGTTNMWISNSMNTLNPMKTCSSGECSLTTDIITGTPYSILIRVTIASNTLNISSFTLDYTGVIYKTKYHFQVYTRDCLNFMKPHANQQINGFYYCPPSAYRCNLLNSENKEEMALIPNYCTSSSWSGNVFSCNTCVENASVVNRICTCNTGFAENHPEGKCLANQYKVEVNLYRESSTTLFDAAVLIVTNPCTQVDNNFFCKESGTSNILYKAIITDFSPKDTLNLSASAYLVEGSYSITINYLKKGGLLRECFSNVVSPGYRSSSIIANFTNSPIGMCIWEGFIKAPESSIELSIKTDDLSYNWIGDYTNIFVISNFPTEDILAVNLIKDKLYYIRVKYYDFVGARYHLFKWRKIGTSTWTDFTSDDMYYPTRPIWNILHATSLSDTLNIVSHDTDLGVYYCPLRCNTCTIKLNGEYSCNTCKGNLVVVNSDCDCLSGFVLDTQNTNCMECPSLCKRCSISNGQLICDECVQNARLIDNECICTIEYPITSNNQCVHSGCQIPISLYNTQDKIIILESSEECLGTNSFICEGINPNQKRYTTNSRTLPYIDNYYLSVISLEQGGLLYQLHSDNSRQNIPIVFSNSGSVTLSGYILSTFTGKYSIRITYSSSTTVLIQDDTYRLKLFTASNFDVYFTQGEFYYIKIQLNAVVGSSLNIELSTDNGSAFSSASNNLYYPTLTTYSPMLLTSCNIMKTLPAIDMSTGIQHCPDICAECNQRIPTSSTTSISCTDCVDRAILSSGSCSCETGTLFNSLSYKCEHPNIDRCISYNDMLKCIECSTRYIVGCDGDCCECDHGYVKVADNPIECILSIPDCEGYNKLDSIWICAKCKHGMRVDPYGKCLDCDEGFSMVANDPFTCAVEILGCIKYIETGLDWKCDLCRSGYIVGCEGYCCECDSGLGYIEVSSNPITCIQQIDNCILYEKYENNWGCGECEEAFQIDMEKQCNICNDDYYKIKEDPLVCIAKIKGCEEYRFYENEFKCNKCEFGYITCNGKCCECNPGYYVSREQPDRCTECPDKCRTCRFEQESVKCLSCLVGYIVINDRCECDTEDFEIIENECISRPFYLSLSYQENGILLSFSKTLSRSLTLNDISISFHSELDTRLLRYNFIPIQDSKEYMIEFVLNFNIQASYDISIVLSDGITDRQNNKLTSSVVYTKLPLLVEGITARSEYCDKSCKECEILNGRVTCVECYDFAQIIEGVCKCYDEEGADPEYCPLSCPDNMTIDNIRKICIECEECIQESENSLEDENQVKEEDRIVSKSTSSSSSASTSAVAIGSALVADKLWSFMNTIQIYSYLPLLTVDMPASLGETLKSQDTTNQYFETFQENFEGGKEPYSKAVEFRYETSLLMRNISRPLLILTGVVSLNILVYLITKAAKGKILAYSEKVLRGFKYKIYLRFYIQFFMDIAIASFLQIIYPIQESASEMIVCTINILLCTFLILTPYMLLAFTYWNFTSLKNEDFSQTWGTFFEEFQILDNKLYSLYYVLFFTRRLIISVALIFFRDLPMIQGILCEASCLSVLIYVAAFRPYKTKIMNVFQTLNEMSISGAYMLSYIFYFDTRLDTTTHSWFILSCVYLSYILHMIVVTENIVKLIISSFKKYKIKERILRLLRRHQPRDETYILR